MLYLNNYFNSMRKCIRDSNYISVIMLAQVFYMRKQSTLHYKN